MELSYKGVQKVIEGAKNVVMQLLVCQEVTEKSNQEIVKFAISDGYIMIRAIAINEGVKKIKQFTLKHSKRPDFTIITLKKFDFEPKRKLCLIYDLQFSYIGIQEMLGEPKSLKNKPADFVYPPNAFKFKKQNNKQNETKQKAIFKQQKKVKTHPNNNNHKTNNHVYDLISTLYPDGIDFRIYVRVKTKGQLKQITTKQGKQMKILPLSLVGTDYYQIRASAFNIDAQRISPIIQQGQCYYISGFQVKLDTYVNNNKNISSQFTMSTYNIMLGKQTKIQTAADDPALPYFKQKQIKLSQLNSDMNKDQLVTVQAIYLAHRSHNAQNFKAKSGKQFKKKACVIADPIKQIQTQLTLWGDIATKYDDIQQTVIRATNLKISDFNGKLGLGSTNTTKIIFLNDHPFFRYINNVEDMNLAITEGQSRVGGNSKTTIFSFTHLIEQLDKIAQNRGTDVLWSQHIVILKKFAQKGVNWYPACPKCKKKVIQDQSYKMCDNCGDSFPQIKYRYLLLVDLQDATDSLRANAGDQIGEKLLGLNCNNAKHSQINFEAAKKHNSWAILKVLLRSKVEQVNQKQYKRHQIAKILNINQGVQAKEHLKLIKSYNL